MFHKNLHTLPHARSQQGGHRLARLLGHDQRVPDVRRHHLVEAARSTPPCRAMAELHAARRGRGVARPRAVDKAKEVTDTGRAACLWGEKQRILRPQRQTDILCMSEENVMLRTT